MNRKSWVSNGLLEQILSECNIFTQQTQESVKGVQSKQQTIKKHYAQQKCRLEFQFKYIVTLLDQKKQELLQQIATHEQQLDKMLDSIVQNISHIQQDIDKMYDDLRELKRELCDQYYDWVDEWLEGNLNQIQNLAQNKRELLSQKMSLVVIEEWQPQHQEAIKMLINQAMVFKDYQKQLETPSEMSASTSSSRSSQDRHSSAPLIISFDQKYFLQKNQISISESEAQDSCESDFLREWAEQ